MKFLIAYATERGGVEGLATLIGAELRYHSHQVVVLPANVVTSVTDYSHVIVGGAVYANRWHHDARKLVHHFAEDLRARPTWLFSVRALTETVPEQGEELLPELVLAAKEINAAGTKTFDARNHNLEGLSDLAAAQLRRAGDWRDEVAVQEWVYEIEGARRTQFLHDLGLGGYVTG